MGRSWAVPLGLMLELWVRQGRWSRGSRQPAAPEGGGLAGTTGRR